MGKMGDGGRKSSPRPCFAVGVGGKEEEEERESEGKYFFCRSSSPLSSISVRKERNTRE